MTKQTTKKIDLRSFGKKPSKKKKSFMYKPKKIILHRTVRLDWAVYGKLRMLREKYGFPDFNSLIDYLIKKERKEVQK